jgi:deoxyribodipyrimidine photolyase
MDKRQGIEVELREVEEKLKNEQEKMVAAMKKSEEDATEINLLVHETDAHKVAADQAAAESKLLAQKLGAVEKELKETQQKLFLMQEEKNKALEQPPQQMSGRPSVADLEARIVQIELERDEARKQVPIESVHYC